MAPYVWANPNNWSQTYSTMLNPDAGVPAGWVLESGSDGAPDAALQTDVAGVNSGGFPPYTEDPGQAAVGAALKAEGRGDWINGILGGGIGG